MGLRLSEGIDLPALAARFDLTERQMIDHRKLALYAAQGLVRREGPRLMVSEPGMGVLDALLPELVALEAENEPA